MAKNNVLKFLDLKGARQRDLVFYLNDRGIKATRQHIHGIVKGIANPVKGSAVRKGICEFFGVQEEVIFGTVVFDKN